MERLVDHTMTFHDIYGGSANKQAQIIHIFDQAIGRRKIYLKHIQKFTQMKKQRNYNTLFT